MYSGSDTTAKITNIATPTNDNDVANKAYVDTKQINLFASYDDDLQRATFNNILCNSRLTIGRGDVVISSVDDFVGTLRVNRITNSTSDFDDSPRIDISTTQVTLTQNSSIYTPTDDKSIVTKKYVDDLVGDINTILATMFNDVSTQSEEGSTAEEVIA